MRFVVGSRYGSRGRVSAQGTGHSLITGGLSRAAGAAMAAMAAMAATMSRRAFIRTSLFSGQHPSLQRGQPSAHRPIEYAVADPYHSPAEDPGIGPEVGPHLPPQRLGEPFDHLLPRARVGLVREGNAGVHPVQLLIQEYLILLRDLGEKALPPAPHDGLQESDEFAWRLAGERALQDLALGGLGHPRRLERGGNSLVRLDRPGDRVEQRAVRVAGCKQRLGVVARDRDAFHRCFCSALPRLSRNSVTSRRFASVSRFASMTRDAAAMDSSTASRRSARIALSFSVSMSLRARESSASYSSRALASRVSRSFWATVFAFAVMSWASVRAAAICFLCSSSSRCASALAFSASSSCFWMRRSRSSTDFSIAGNANRHSRTSRMPKTTSVQMINPGLIVNGPPPAPPPPPASCASCSSSSTYANLKRRANTNAASVAPSTSAAVRIIAPRMSADASGWRAIASTAWPPMRPMPRPAPMIASPIPMPAPSRALLLRAAASDAWSSMSRVCMWFPL